MKYCRFRSVCKLSITNFSIKPKPTKVVVNQLYYCTTERNTEDATKNRRKEARDKDDRKSQEWRQQREEKQTKKGKLRYLHLQSSETSSSRHRNIQQSHEYFELVRQRHLRANCNRVFSTRQLQQKVYNQLSRNSDRHSTASARWTGETRGQWRNKSRYKVHQHKVKRFERY